MRTVSVISICSAAGVVKATVPITPASRRRWKLMEEDSITLNFHLAESIDFGIGDYIDDELFGVFTLSDDPVPADYDPASGAYKYELRFDAEWICWKNKVLMLTVNGVRKKTNWVLTDTLSNHLSVVIQNLTALGYTGYSVSVEDTVEDPTRAVCITYSGTSILDAMKALADAYECEFWVDGNKVIHFGKCETGTERVLLSMTDDDGRLINVENMVPTRNDSEYGNRFFVYGSTKNIPETYRKHLTFVVDTVSGSKFKDSKRPVYPDMMVAREVPNPSPTESSISTSWQIISYSRPTSVFRSKDIPVLPGSSLGIYYMGDIEGCSVCYMNGATEVKVALAVDVDVVYWVVPSGVHSVQLECTYDGVEHHPILTYTDDTTYGYYTVMNWVRNGTPQTTNVKLVDGYFVVVDAIPESTPGQYQSLPPGFSTGIWFTLPFSENGSDGLKITKVPASYYTEDDPDDYRIVGERRLLLPLDPAHSSDPDVQAIAPHIANGYVQRDVALTRDEVVERVVYFEEIYPRCALRITHIDVSEYANDTEYSDGSVKIGSLPAYTLQAERVVKNGTDQPFPFDPETMRTVGKLTVTFLTPDEAKNYSGRVSENASPLMGMTFEVACNRSNGVTTYQIAWNNEYGEKLPNSILGPQVGDCFILAGWNTAAMSSLGLLESAENELAKTADEYARLLEEAQFTFDCYMMSDWVLNGRLPQNLRNAVSVQNAAGTRVSLNAPPPVSFEMLIRFTQGTNGYLYLMQCRASSSGAITGIMGSKTNYTTYASYAGTSISSSCPARVVGHTYEIKFTKNGAEGTLVVKDLTAGTTYTNTASNLPTSAVTKTLQLFGNGYQNVPAGQKVHYAYLKDANGNFIFELLPAVDGNDEACYYDVARDRVFRAVAGSLSANGISGIPANLLGMGQKVTVHHGALRADKDTRVIAYELKLDIPYDTPVYTVGESEAYSRLREIEKSLNARSSSVNAANDSSSVNISGGGSAGGGGGQPLHLVTGTMVGMSSVDYDGSEEKTFRVPSVLDHLADAAQVPRIASDGQGGTKLVDVQGNEVGGSFFVTVQDTQDPTKYSVKLKPQYTGLWAEGWVAAGGVGSPGGGGGGGGLITSVKGVADLGTPIASESLTETFSSKAIETIYEAVQALQQSTPNVSLSNGLNYSTLTVNSVTADIYTKSQVDVLIGSINQFRYEIVASTSVVTHPQSNVLYLVGPTGTGADRYEEYVYANNTWTKIGDTSIDLSGYVTLTNLNTTLADYVTNTALASWTGSQNITTLGTISTGVWSGTAIGVTKGGTGLTSISKGQILYGSASNTIATLNANGTATKKFLSQTSNNAPAWSVLQTSDIPDLSGTYLPLSGGTVTGQVNFKDIIGYDVVNDSGWWIADDSTAGGFSEIETACILIGPVKIVYDSSTTALHITTNVPGNDAPVIGLYADGFVAAGGVGSGGGGGGGSQSLSGLTDVTISSLQNGDLLVYNSTTSHWENARQSAIVPSISVVVPSSGNALTGASASGGTITFTKGSFVESANFTLSNLSGADDLKAIEALTGTSGLLKKTAANTWALDTNAYITSAALSGYLPLTGGTLTGPLNITPSANSALSSNGLDFGSVAHIGSATSGAVGIYSSGGIYLRPGDGSMSSSYGVVLSTTGFTYNGNDVYHAGNLKPMRRYVYSASGTRSYYWVKIANTDAWMGSFTVKIYCGYHHETYEIGGYNYQTGWYLPRARLIDSTSRASVDLKFGYDAANELWFLIPTIDDTTNKVHGIIIYGFCGNRASGKHLVEDEDFSCTLVSSLDDVTGTTEFTYTYTNTLTGITGVRLDTDQEITGNKTFSSGLITIKTATSGTPTLLFQRGTGSDNYVDWKIKCDSGALDFIRSVGGTDTSKYRMNNDAILPLGTITSNVSDLTLGSTSNRWETVYAANGDLSGNLSVAGNITINSANTGTPTLVFQRGTGADTYVDWKVINQMADGAASLHFIRSYNGTDTTKYVMTTEAFRPDGTLTSGVSNLTLGASSYRWGSVYSAAGDFSGNLSIGGDLSVAGSSSFGAVNIVTNTSGTPSLVLQRGTASDNYWDWIIRNQAGDLHFLYSVGGTENGRFTITGASVRAHSDTVTDGVSSISLGTASVRWSNVYSNEGNFAADVAVGGDLSLDSSSHIDIGPARIEYANGAIHITTNQTGANAPIMGLYADGFVSAGGVGSGGGSAGDLEGLTDVTISSPHNDGDLLVYNGTTNHWENKPQSQIVPSLSVVVPSTGNALTGVTASGATLTFTTGTFLTAETDPVFTASAAAGITANDITNWNGKTSNTGTVTSVTISAGTGISVSSSSAITTSGTRTISISSAYQTKISNGDSAYTTLTTSRNAGLVLASPASGSGAPSFRALVASDIPDLSGTYLTSESDPVFTASAAHGISSSDISNWNGKADASALNNYALKTGASTYDFEVKTLILPNGTLARSSAGSLEERISFTYTDTSTITPATVTKILAYTSDLPTAASLGAVTLTGTQTISGAKTFSAATAFTGNISVAGTVSVAGKDMIDLTQSGMTMFGFGSRAERSFNAYGTTVNLRVCDANGDQVNILSVQPNIITANSKIIPNYMTGLDLGGSSANQRWSTIYGVNANLSGNLALASTSHVEIGDAWIVYDSTNHAIRVTKKTGTSNDIGFYADSWVAAGGAGTGGGGGITVDSALSSTSENPVQNKAIYAVIGDVESLLAAI